MFAQANDILSNKTAISVIHIPASKAKPIRNWFKANNKFQPSPFAPIKDAITAIAKHCMITWLTPIKISLRAVGINTLNKSWKLLHPLIFPASITSGETFLSPSKVNLTIGGVAKIIVAIAPAWSPIPNKTIIGTK